MTIEDVVKKAVEDHYKMTGRAIGKGDLQNDAGLRLGTGISPADFNRALETLKRAKRIRETKSDYYAPYGVKANDGPFPMAKDIVPTPRRKKNGPGRKA